MKHNRYSVVNAQAGVWRCDWCQVHIASVMEHDRECPFPLHPLPPLAAPQPTQEDG